jgi:hypothetical protein
MPARPATSTGLPSSAAAALDFHSGQVRSGAGSVQQSAGQHPVNGAKLSSLLSNLQLSPPMAALQGKNNAQRASVSGDRARAGGNNNYISEMLALQVAAEGKGKEPASPSRPSGGRRASVGGSSGIPIVSARPKTADGGSGAQLPKKAINLREDLCQDPVPAAPVVKPRQGAPAAPSRSKSASALKPTTKAAVRGREEEEEDALAAEEQYDEMLLDHVNNKMDRAQALKEKEKEKHKETGAPARATKAAAGNQPAPAASAEAVAGEDKVTVHHAVKLLYAHKLAIAEMVEVMKDEMELVQTMETAAERDADGYIESLEGILQNKETAILSLQAELKRFKELRSGLR